MRWHHLLNNRGFPSFRIAFQLSLSSPPPFSYNDSVGATTRLTQRVPAASKVAAAGYRPAATSSENVVHTYNTPGRYFVVLTVTDNDGAVGSDVTVVEVASSGGGSGSSSDFPGCSIGSHKVNDPILPLFVVLSLIYLARRRLGFVS